MKLTLTQVAIVVLFTIAILSWVDHTDLAYDDYTYPDAVQAIGWVIEVGPLFIVALYPIWSVYRLYQDGARGKELCSRLFRPTPSWYSTPRDNKKKKAGENIEENLSSAAQSSSSK